MTEPTPHGHQRPDRRGVKRGLRGASLACVVALLVGVPAIAEARPSWDKPKNDGCKGWGKRQYSARLKNARNWERDCRATSIKVRGRNIGRPTRCDNHGLGGMWGIWTVDDASCRARWGRWTTGQCTAGGKRIHYARLLDTRTKNWDAECRKTPFTLSGKKYQRPTRCVNKGVGGMYGEVDLPDASCRAKWGTWTKGDCKGIGKRTHYARLLDTQTKNWDAECKGTPVTLKGRNHRRPTRCVNKGVGGMYGEIDLPDSSCKAKWDTWTKGNCNGPGKRTHYARLLDTQTKNWDAECKGTPVTLKGKRYTKPTRCVNKGVAGMYGEIDLRDRTCEARWDTWTKADCTPQGKRIYYSRLLGTQSKDWDRECKVTGFVLNDRRYGRPSRCLDKGISGMWGEVEVDDAKCIQDIKGVEASNVPAEYQAFIDGNPLDSGQATMSEEQLEATLGVVGEEPSGPGATAEDLRLTGSDPTPKFYIAPRNRRPPVLSQGACGSCVAFTAALVMASVWYRESGISDLMPGAFQLFQKAGRRCDGGWNIGGASEWLVENGAPLGLYDTEAKPDGFKDSLWVTADEPKIIHPTKMGSITDPDLMRRFLWKRGPLLARMDTPRNFQRYSKGIYNFQKFQNDLARQVRLANEATNDPKKREKNDETLLRQKENMGGHAMAIIGYFAGGQISLWDYLSPVLPLMRADDEKAAKSLLSVVKVEAPPYWIVQNSYGSDWGMNGLIYIAAGQQYTLQFDSDHPRCDGRGGTEGCIARAGTIDDTTYYVMDVEEWTPE